MAEWDFALERETLKLRTGSTTYVPLRGSHVLNVLGFIDVDKRTIFLSGTEVTGERFSYSLDSDARLTRDF